MLTGMGFQMMAATPQREVAAASDSNRDWRHSQAALALAPPGWRHHLSHGPHVIQVFKLLKFNLS